MHKPELCLFRHPTTTVFVDDSDDFLYSIALGVDRLPYRSFSVPAQGLAYVNQFTSSHDCPAAESLPSGSPALGKLFSRACSRLNNERRFAEPSVLVVDHSMPSMTGLELCSQITNPNIKKVLLTGVADERMAIEALNIDLIDFYISKRESGLAQRLRSIIAHLETRYFQDLYGWSRDSEVRTALPQLFDAAFADYFEDVVERLNIVEYYPLIDNSGFRLISGYGQCTRLLVLSEAQLNERLDTLDTSGLSPEVREKLSLFELIPASVSSTVARQPEDQLLPAILVEGTERWYCALSNDGVLDDAISYQHFLRTPHSYNEPCMNSV